MERRLIKITAKKILSLLLIAAYTLTFILQDARFSFAGNYGSAASAGNQFMATMSAVQSFQPDLFTGRASLSIPIAVPPGRQNIHPGLALSYSSSGGNGWIGVGWGLDTGVISRSTKNGVPKYDSTDAYVFAFHGVSSELISIGGQEYRAKDEGLFLRFVFTGSSWEIYDKSGTKYTFGSTDESRCANASGAYAWYLDKSVDVNGNYFTVSYTKDQGQVYLSEIRYTGHETAPVEPPTRSVNFTLEIRADQPRDLRSGYEIVTAKRLKEISVKSETELARKYVLDYTQSARSSRSLLTSVTQYGSDGVSSLPPVTFSYQDSLQMSYSTWGKDAGLPYLQFAGDYNADGYYDMAEFLANGAWKVSLSDGSYFTQGTTWVNSFGDSTTVPILGDFNGDGRTDICVFSAPTGNWKVALSNGSNFVNPCFWAEGFGTGLAPISGDFNGDGLTDIGVFYTTTGDWSVALSTGSAFAPQSTAWISGFGSSLNKPFVGDFNGDGLTDIATSDGDLGSGNIYCALSDGTKFLTPSLWISGFGGYSHVTSDFNNDGLTDVGYLNRATDIVHYAPSTGFSFGEAKQIDPGFYLQGNPLNLQTGDFNGDGLTDVATIRETDLHFQIGLPRAGAVDLISTLNNGIGGSSTVTYEPSSSYDNTGGDGSPDLPFVIQTVKAITVSDGTGHSYATNYAYSGGKYNAASKDFLGFGYAKVTDIDGNYSETYFKQGINQRGLPYEQCTRDAQGNLYAKTTNTYVCVEPYTGVYLNQLTQTDAFIYDGDTSYKQTRARFEYDSYGNIITAYNDGELDLTGDETKTVTSYTHNTADWILGRPAVASLYDSELNKISEKKFYYDGNSLPTDSPIKGKLTKEEVWLNTSQDNPSTTYAYDYFGNVTQITDALGRSITNTYDSTCHAYVVQVTNALSHSISYDYDYRLGVATSTTDANNVTSRTEYDVFGRTLKVIGPYDTSSLPTVSYEYDLSTTPVKATSHNREISGSSEVGTAYAFYDGLGRMIQVRTPAEDPEKQIVSGTVTYTSRGETKEKYMPFFEDTSANYVASDLTGKPKIAYTYDAVGRLTQITSADSTYSTVQYSDWVKTSTDENGRQRRYTNDAYGRMIKVEEFNGPDIYATTYEYDAQGNLVKVTDALGNITTVNYDSLGRKTSMSDLDMGNWSYSYDLLGNLVSQTDAKGQTINFQYDQLNRLTLKDHPTGADVMYTYDDPAVAYSKGRLTKVEYASGSATFEYDKLGREIESAKTIDGTSYTVQRAYDNLNRLTSLTYPDDDVISYTYNAAGAIETVKQGMDFYVSSVDYSPSGQITKITYGNNTTTEYLYNADNLRLSRLTTKDPSSALLQDLLYTYDNTGNITQIQDLRRSNNTQNFTYDDLNRLTSARGGYGTYAYSYNAIGNIIQKEGKDYSYLSSKPHAVTSLSDGTSFTYDYNGNMAQKLEKGNPQLKTIYTYDCENRLTQVTFPKPETAALNLSAGWNFVSVPVIPDDNAITSLIPDFGQDIDQISRYNSETDAFEHYVNDPAYADFTTLDYAKGYEVYVKNPNGATVTIQGKVPTVSISESLNTGSNLIPSVTLSSDTPSWLANNLAQGTDYDYIWKYNKSGSSFESLSGAWAKESYFLNNIGPDPLEWTMPVPPDNVITFAYDGDGGRIKKTSFRGEAEAVSTTYVGSLYEIENGAAKKHIFMGSQRIASKTSAATEYYHSDHLGSANIITDSNGAQIQRFEYRPFGSTYLAQGTSATNYKYTGKESDPTGLYYYGARYYDPEIGRFIQADTIVQSPFDSQNLNRYTYCRNNPLIYTDPTGNFWQIIAAIAAFIATAASVVSVGATVVAMVTKDETAGKVAKISGIVAAVAGITNFFANVAQASARSLNAADLISSFDDGFAIELEPIIVRPSATMALASGFAASKNSLIAGAVGALNWTSYNIIGPLVNTATNPGCNYGLYLSDLDAGRFSFRNFYGASLDSAWAVSGMGSAAGIAKAGYNSSFSQYYGANLNPNNQWLTRGRYSLDVAMKKLSSPGEWTGMRGVQVPWEKYVGGPRIAAPKFGKSGWGIEYKIGGFGFTKEGNWIEYFGDWLKAAVDVVIK